MKQQSRHLILIVLLGMVGGGAACTQRTTDIALETTEDASAPTEPGLQGDAENTEDPAQDPARRTVDEARDSSRTTAEKATEIAGGLATRARELAVTTGEAITDTWVTTKVSAKLADETLLNGSHIDVDTDNRVVTLKGTVASVAAKDRAAAIAEGTEGVTRVVNQLVVA